MILVSLHPRRFSVLKRLMTTTIEILLGGTLLKNILFLSTGRHGPAPWISVEVAPTALRTSAEDGGMSVNMELLSKGFSNRSARSQPRSYLWSTTVRNPSLCLIFLSLSAP